MPIKPVKTANTPATTPVPETLAALFPLPVGDAPVCVPEPDPVLRLPVTAGATVDTVTAANSTDSVFVTSAVPVSEPESDCVQTARVPEIAQSL